MESDLDDQDFAVEVDDYGYARLRFGNGLGKQPSADMHFYATYRVGGGQGGNVGADSIVRVVFRRGLHTVIRSIRNPLPALGGRDAESLNHIKLHAPHSLKTLDRAIIADDYVQILRREFPYAIQGVHCSISSDIVTIAIDPKSGNSFDSLKPYLQDVVEKYRRVGHIVLLKPPSYVGISIRMQVKIEPGQSASRVRLELLERFGSGMLANGELAFFNPDRFTFGDNIHKSQIIAEAMKVEGVVNAVLFQFDKWNATGTVDTLTFWDEEIPILLNNPSEPKSGTFELEVL